MNNFLEFKSYQIPSVLVGKTGGGESAMARFAEISAWHMTQLDRYIGIKPDDKVVEIGCGIGRVAIPLAERLESGNYLGTDTIRPSIEWCQNNISLKHKNFEFIHHDIQDDLHNPKGTIHASDVVIPRPDASIDLIILHSVFTHMFHSEVLHYMKEFRRILKPTGRVWASFFLADDEILSKLNEGHNTAWGLSFQHVTEMGDRVNSASSPRGAVLFTEAAIQALCVESKLSVEHMLHGQWSGMRSVPKSGQDAIVFMPTI